MSPFPLNPSRCAMTPLGESLPGPIALRGEVHIWCGASCRFRLAVPHRGFLDKTRCDRPIAAAGPATRCARRRGTAPPLQRPNPAQGRRMPAVAQAGCRASISRPMGAAVEAAQAALQIQRRSFGLETEDGCVVQECLAQWQELSGDYAQALVTWQTLAGPISAAGGAVSIGRL